MELGRPPLVRQPLRQEITKGMELGRLLLMRLLLRPMEVMEGTELGRLLLVPQPLRPMAVIEGMELERLLLCLLQEIMGLLVMMPLRNLHKLKLVPRA